MIITIEILTCTYSVIYCHYSGRIHSVFIFPSSFLAQQNINICHIIIDIVNQFNSIYGFAPTHGNVFFKTTKMILIDVRIFSFGVFDPLKHIPFSNRFRQNSGICLKEFDIHFQFILLYQGYILSVNHSHSIFDITKKAVVKFMYSKNCRQKFVLMDLYVYLGNLLNILLNAYLN